MNLPGTASPVEPFGAGAGYIDHLNPSNPAAGSGLVIPLDPSFVWRPLSLRFQVDTSAAAANRLVTVDYTDQEGNVWVRNGVGLVLTASTVAQVFDWNAQRTTAEWAANTDIYAPLSDFFIPPGWQVRINVANVQAADQVSAVRFYVEKWVTGRPGGRGSGGYGGFPIPRPSG